MLLQRSIRLLPLAAVVVGCVASQAIEPTDVMSEEFVSTRAPCGNNCPPWEPLGFPDEVVISDGDTVTMRMVEHFFGPHFVFICLSLPPIAFESLFHSSQT